MEQEPFEQQQTFDLLTFLKEPDNSYDNLISQTLSDDELQFWGDEALFARYGAELAYNLQFLAQNEEFEAKRTKLFELLKNKLSNKILVELGGDSFDRVAEKTGARVYISVDLFLHGKESISDPTHAVSDKLSSSGCRMLYVKADMLDFIRRLPDKSVSITINGIDLDIIPSDEYHMALMKEIERVAEDGGLVFGNNAVCFDYIDSSGDSGLKPALVPNFSHEKFFEKNV